MADTYTPCPTACALGSATAWAVCPLSLLPAPCLAGDEDEGHVSHWREVVWLARVTLEMMAQGAGAGVVLTHPFGG